MVASQAVIMVILTRAAEIVGHRVGPDLGVGSLDESGHLERLA